MTWIIYGCIGSILFLILMVRMAIKDGMGFGLLTSLLILLLASFGIILGPFWLALIILSGLVSWLSSMGERNW